MANSKSVRRENITREIRHGMRGESAQRCIGKITSRCEIFGLTKGDFSMIDILRHIAAEIGPCKIDIGTWTAARSDIAQAEKMMGDKNITGMRWLVDRSFPARQPEYYQSLLAKFGRDSVRLARFHAKYILLENESYSVAVRTSMNLNMNKRIEFYEISEGTPISGYLREVTDQHFSQPSEDSYGLFKSFQINRPPKKDVEINKRIGDW